MTEVIYLRRSASWGGWVQCSSDREGAMPFVQKPLAEELRYTVVNIEAHNIPDLDSQLNAHAKNGWSLVCFSRNGSSFLTVLKRGEP